MFTIDKSTAFGARVTRQLTEEKVIWLTTVGKSEVPHPTPVWFYWTGSEILVFSMPGNAKLYNIASHPGVSLNFNATPAGGDIGVITGDAVVDEGGPSDEERAAYDRKCADAMAAENMTPEQMHEAYSVLIRITPSKLRGF